MKHQKLLSFLHKTRNRTKNHCIIHAKFHSKHYDSMKMAYFWRKGLWALMSLFFVLIVAGSLFYLYLESQLPNVDSLKTVQLQVPLQIFSKEGLLIQEYGEKKRIPVTYDEIPPMLIHALIATEDQRFLSILVWMS